jgi:prepilin-type N-terminal cleavage/methylation domain-containing protein
VRTLGLGLVGGFRTRARLRVRGGGFSLLELMVVVILVSILSILAIPTMRRMRDDKAAFDYARQIQQMIHRGRARAQGTGGAHLVTYDAGTDGRGRVLLFEARDGAAPPAGPNFIGGCKRAAQWDDVLAFTPGGLPGPRARIVDGLDLNSLGINVDADIRSVAALAGAEQPALAMCITPNGTTFVGVGGGLGAAILSMQEQQQPFSDVAEVRVFRRAGGTQVGLTRRVIAVGSASPRIRSE